MLHDKLKRRKYTPILHSTRTPTTDPVETFCGCQNFQGILKRLGLINCGIKSVHTVLTMIIWSGAAALVGGLESSHFG